MTLKLGRNLITNHLSKIGDEQWDIYEQIFIAAIDIGDFLSAEHYLQLITTQFPGNTRWYDFEIPLRIGLFRSLSLCANPLTRRYRL